MKINSGDIISINPYLAELMNNNPVPAFAVDKNGRVIMWNRAIENLTGRNRDSSLGKADFEHSIPFFGKRNSFLQTIYSTQILIS